MKNKTIYLAGLREIVSRCKRGSFLEKREVAMCPCVSNEMLFHAPCCMLLPYEACFTIRGNQFI